MVRLVFRRYTQLLRSICTSESLRTSTRVSSGFVLARHSSPSFGSQRVRSRCAAPTKRTRRPRSAPLPRVEGILRHPLARASLSLRLWVSMHPMTRAHVRLLGPCFKTGRTGRVCERRTDDRIGRRAADTQSTAGNGHACAWDPPPGDRGRRHATQRVRVVPFGRPTSTGPTQQQPQELARSRPRGRGSLQLNLHGARAPGVGCDGGAGE